MRELLVLYFYYYYLNYVKQNSKKNEIYTFVINVWVFDVKCFVFNWFLSLLCGKPCQHKLLTLTPETDMKFQVVRTCKPIVRFFWLLLFVSLFFFSFFYKYLRVL